MLRVCSLRTMGMWQPPHLHLLAQHIHHLRRLAALGRGKDAHLRERQGGVGEVQGHEAHECELDTGLASAGRAAQAAVRGRSCGR